MRRDEALSPETLDSLELAEGKCLSVDADGTGLAATPMTREHDGQWRRALPGDGLAEALIHLLAQTSGSVTHGRFTVHSWTGRTAAGEQSVGVDQTNESVIVGDAAVVKWATHLAHGPHPAPRRIGVLREAGFGGMPVPWGLVTWQLADGTETMVANVDEYLPGAVDGWTWAVDLITDAAHDRDPPRVLAAAADVGALVAEMHAALAGTATVASASDAARWRDTAFSTLETACGLGISELAGRRGEMETILGGLDALAGTPALEGHGDLHVGQVLLTGGRFMVTDFDGNPVLSAEERMLPIPAALDVAGMMQSLAHVAIVARKYTPLDPTTLAEVDGVARAGFLAAYTRRLTALGHTNLFDPVPLHALRIQQVLREFIYAARYLPRWRYVPDAALPPLLDEGPPP